MKNPIMLVCAMVAAVCLSTLAEEPAKAAAAGEQAQVQAGKGEKGKHKQLTEAEREAMMTKRLEKIKEKDEALYKELVALKEKDPEAFKLKMRELGKAQAEAGKGAGKREHKGKGAGRGKHKDAADKPAEAAK